MQNTIKAPIEFKGVGVHKGEPATMRVCPAGVDEGITFIRSDVTDTNNVIPASYEHVVPSELCTLMEIERADSTQSGEEGDKIVISTVEHILSALRGLNIDNARIYLSGPEIPIMDGSAIEFVREIERVGIQVQDKERRYIKVLREVRFEMGEKYATLSPSDIPRFSYEIDFDAPIIGRQSVDVALLNGNYRAEIAEARTFGLLAQVEYMRSKGLALGGSLDNAVVVDHDKVVNPEGLRFETEFVRHKTLDAIGDLYLAGAPIIGAFHGYKAGHALHVGLVRELMSDPANYEIVQGDEIDAGLSAMHIPVETAYLSSLSAAAE